MICCQIDPFVSHLSLGDSNPNVWFTGDAWVVRGDPWAAEGAMCHRAGQQQHSGHAGRDVSCLQGRVLNPSITASHVATRQVDQELGVLVYATVNVWMRCWNHFSFLYLSRTCDVFTTHNSCNFLSAGSVASRNHWMSCLVQFRKSCSS